MCNKTATGADLSEGGAPTQGDNPDVIPSHVAGMAGSLAVLGGFMCQLDTNWSLQRGGASAEEIPP